jgi:hypothetical protein
VQPSITGRANAAPHAFGRSARFPGAGCRTDAAGLDALALALAHCDLVACDAFMADVLRRTRLDLHHECELFSGRRPDVTRLRDRLRALTDHQRARGSLLGLAVGDALGAPLEGAPAEVARQAVAEGLEMTGGGVWAREVDRRHGARAASREHRRARPHDTDDVASLHRLGAD